MVLAAVLVLPGCSGPPSEDVGRQVLSQRIARESNGKISLLRFTKTNATGNDNFYQLEYEAEIEFLETGIWTAGKNSSPAFEFSTGQMAQGSVMAFMGNVTGASNVQQGQHTSVKGTLSFAKTERGWKGEDGNLY